MSKRIMVMGRQSAAITAMLAHRPDIEVVAELPAEEKPEGNYIGIRACEDVSHLAERPALKELTKPHYERFRNPRRKRGFRK